MSSCAESYNNIYRMHRFKRGDNFKGNLRGNLLTQRVIVKWNGLPEEVGEVGTITVFKRHLAWHINGAV